MSYEPKRYRHLPTVVEAIRYDGSALCAGAIVAWGRDRTGNLPFTIDGDDLVAHTPQGPRYVPEGWLAVLGVIGEPYSVQPMVEAVAYVEVTADYRAPLTADRVADLVAEARGTISVDRLRDIVAQLGDHSEALMA